MPVYIPFFFRTGSVSRSRSFSYSVNAAPPVVRKYQPGHYIAIGAGSNRRGSYWHASGGANLLTLAGVRGVQLRYRWDELESSQGVYTFGTVKGSYTDDERSVRADLWRCAQNDRYLVLMVEDKSFASSPMINPMPPYLRGTTYVLTNQNGGYTSVRWNPTVVTRLGALIAALGEAFDGDPNLYAIAFTETSLGLTQGQRDNATPQYTDDRYRDALITMLENSADAFPTSNTFWYQNFFPLPTSDGKIDEVVDAVRDYRGGDHGIVLGGPDILPDNKAVRDRCVPRYHNPPPVGSYTEIPLFCSMQNDSYWHTHTTSTPDARMPGDTWTSGTKWTMDQLFRYGRDYLHLNYMMWNFPGGSASEFQFLTDGSSVVAANPTFNT